MVDGETYGCVKSFCYLGDTLDGDGGDRDWVRKCIEVRVEGRRPVGRPKRTWLESVEADMAELEIDKGVHDRNKWRRNVVMRMSNPIGKRTIYR